MKIEKLKVDGAEVSVITDSIYHYSFGYFTANKWIDENRIVLIRGKSYELDEFNRTAELVLADINNGKEELLYTFNSAKPLKIGAGYCEAYVVSGNTVYFIDVEGEITDYESVLYKFDISDRSIKEIYRGKNFYFPHITNDGKYLNIELLPDKENGLYGCVVIDTETEIAEIVFSKKFNKPFEDLAHIMICPTDKDKIFFCHEGDTFYVSNRLWMYEKGKDMKCIAEQRLDTDGNLGDCFGHECWTADGKGLYFVKYNCSPMGPKGISYVNADGTGQRTAIYGKYPYWHVCASPDGRFLASDTQSGSYSGVCLIDTFTGDEKLLYKAKSSWSHPTHPHPSFNLDGSKIIFHHIIDSKNCIGIINIKDVFNG